MSWTRPNPENPADAPRLPSGDAARCDLLVVGSGAAGMAAAITARLHGLDVRLVEKAPLVGGSTAYSYGTMWIPANPVSRREGIVDDLALARRYLSHEMPVDHDAACLEAFLTQAPRMVAFLEERTAARFLCRTDFPDHHPHLPGALGGGRTIMTAPFDARCLGPALARLRPPMPGQTWLGMMYTPQENKLVSAGDRRWRAAAHLARRAARHLVDLARFGRTTWLTNGNALAARLFKTCNDLGIPIHTEVSMRRLLVEDGRVTGAELEQHGGRTRLLATRGVVLACGGFGRSVSRCHELFERPPLDGQDWSLAPEGNTGDGQVAAMAAGARMDERTTTAAFWAPVSRPRLPRGELAGHFHDRHRPGFLAVNREGRRFASEAMSNHHFAEAIVRAAPAGTAPLAWLVTDHRSLRRTGCGDAILPFPARLGPHLRSGYLVRAETIGDLARAIGVPAPQLERTVAVFNAAAAQGLDPDFDKGGNAFERYFGQAGHGPNPNVGPLGAGPYYAVRMTAGHMGTLAGLRTDPLARPLADDGRPIPGLYAVGNDMANVFGGACPGGGITLGPGMTFAWLAARHAAGDLLPSPAGPSPTPTARESAACPT